MPHTRYSSEEITWRGKELYEQRIRPLVETDETLARSCRSTLKPGILKSGTI
jgi:hypothetical protein